MDNKEIEKLCFHIVTLDKLRVSKYSHCAKNANKSIKRKEFCFCPVLLLKYKNLDWWILPSPLKIGYLFLFYDPTDKDVIIECYILCGFCLYAVSFIKSGMDAKMKQMYQSYTKSLNEIHLALLCDKRVTKEDIISIYDLYKKYGVNKNEFNPQRLINDVLNS